MFHGSSGDSSEDANGSPGKATGASKGTHMDEEQSGGSSRKQGGGGATESSSSARPVYTPPRDTRLRPVYKLSVELIDTYKYINRVYYEARAKKAAAQEQISHSRGGVLNDGYDDQHYDYIIHSDEVFYERYVLKHRIGKGSFGQVVCAYDQQTMKEVAIKIIKSRRPFTLQAQTEINLLSEILQKDKSDEYNLVRMINKFVFRNHQCLVFEMLSYNLYELLKNTRFKGVSLNLIRKFSKQILHSLNFLASPEVDIIHCDLKPENILLRHPRRSAIKLIDFGSSCLSTKKTYTYIQSRFYRSPEILLGLKYDQKIDIWSLGCVLVEMHIGEPLFGGSNQIDQMCRIVDVLGMPPYEMIELSPSSNKNNFFLKIESSTVANSACTGTGIGTGTGTGTGIGIGTGNLPNDCDMNCCIASPDGKWFYVLRRPNKDSPAPRTLAQIIGVDSGGPFGRRKEELGHSRENYIDFLSFIQCLLIFDPVERVSASEAMRHPYITERLDVMDSEDQGHEKGTKVSVGAVSAGGAGAALGANNPSILEKRRGRELSEWNPRSRSLSAPAGAKQTSNTNINVGTAAFSRPQNSSVTTTATAPTAAPTAGTTASNISISAASVGKSTGGGTWMGDTNTSMAMDISPKHTSTAVASQAKSINIQSSLPFNESSSLTTSSSFASSSLAVAADIMNSDEKSQHKSSSSAIAGVTTGTGIHITGSGAETKNGQLSHSSNAK